METVAGLEQAQSCIFIKIVLKDKNAVMNLLVTPTSQQIQDCLPTLVRDVTNMVFGYLGRPFVASFEVLAGGRIQLPLLRSIIVGKLDKVEEDDKQEENDEPLHYDFEVNWGDGSECSRILSYNDSNGTHEYAAAGVYTLHITGRIPGLCFGIAHWSRGRVSAFFNNTQDQILNISQWGELELHSGRWAFAFCRRLGITATDAPNLQHATDLTGMFYLCEALTDEDLSSWQTKEVVSIAVMFSGCTNFNGVVNTWSTSKVTGMGGVFQVCPLFNGDLSKWDTSSATTMISMFNGCSNFRGDLSGWNTSRVTNMSYLLKSCTNFNGDLSKWKTDCVTTMSHMFQFCESVNGDLSVSSWVTDKVENMKKMFEGCSSYKLNGDMRRWVTDKVKDMKDIVQRLFLF